MHSNKEKSLAIRQLVVNLGDVEQTHLETKIAKSTLFRWKKELRSHNNILFWEQDSKSRIIMSSYEGIRDQMLTQIQRFLSKMEYYGPEHAPAYATSAVRLTDRIVKVESLLELAGQYSITIDLKNFGESDEEDQRQERLSAPDLD